MNFDNLLNQVLNVVKNNISADSQMNSQQNSGSNFNLDQLGIDQNTLLKIGGSAAASVLSMIFKGNLTQSHQKGNKNNKLMQAGSLAAIGALAFQAFQKWQSQQQAANNSANALAAIPSEHEFQHQGQSADETSRIILRTMIAAAVADGLVSDEENQLITQKSDQIDPQAQQWLTHELQHPVTPVELAREVGNNRALAAQVYLAARLICGDLDRKEIIFLSQLAQVLNLDEQLVESLEKQAGF